MKQACVYMLIFPNGKKYVGVSTNPYYRLRQHKWKKKTVVSKAIKAIGVPMLVVLYMGSEDDCYSNEPRFIYKHDTLLPNGYNQEMGGLGGSGRKHSEATKAKMRLAHAKRKPISEETRQKQSISAKRRGMKRSVIEAGAAANRGRKQTAEHRKKNSEAVTKWWAERRGV